MLVERQKLAAESDRLLRSGQYDQLLSLLRPLPYGDLSPDLRHRRAFAALRSGQHVEALRFIQNDPDVTPILRRLEIEVLCAFRHHREIVKKIRQTFEEFPVHGADFAYFALLELVFHRAFLEARFVIEHAIRLFSQYAPSAVLDFKNREQFVDQTEVLFDRVLLDKRYSLALVRQRFGDLDAPVVWWKRYLAGELAGEAAEIIQCFSDRDSPLRPLGEATYFDGQSGDKITFPELAMTKCTLGFRLRQAELTSIDDAPNLFVPDGRIFPQLAASGSTTNAGFCVRSNTVKRKPVPLAIMAPPLGDVGYFNAIMNGLFCLLVRQKYFSSLPIMIPTGYNPILKAYAEILGIDEQSLIWGADCDGLCPETSIIFLNEGRSLDARSIDVFRKMIAELFVSKLTAVRTSERIYISRSKAKQRKLVNEPEIEIALAELGFEILHFEDMDPIKQIMICNGARFVVAPHGAGLTNLLFAHRMESLVELMPASYHVRGFENMARQGGASYVGVIGKTETSGVMPSMTWVVETKTVVKIVADILLPKNW